ncbi:hypothetical protein D3C80_376070 [compost metagenome]
MSEGFRAVWNDAGVLGENRIPRRQVRRQHAHQLVIGEVPRLHRHQHADRMVFNPRLAELRGILHRGEKALGVIGVIAGDLRAELHLTAALADELAHILAGNFRQLLNPAIDKVRQPVQDR